MHENDSVLWYFYYYSFIYLHAACNNGPEPNATVTPPPPASLSYAIQRVLPHDTSSFTEGLLIYKAHFMKVRETMENLNC
jgi:glutamine cyclotransferase